MEIGVNKTDGKVHESGNALLRQPTVAEDIMTPSLSDRSALIGRVNRKKWWHTPPVDPEAYAKRGKFYASSFSEAEFYGRPNRDSERVTIANPLVGDEEAIEMFLFGARPSRELEILEIGLPRIEARLALDERIKEAATTLGFDSILLMTPQGYAKYLGEGKIPRSLELNVLR